MPAINPIDHIRDAIASLQMALYAMERPKKKRRVRK
jgi:hypothetical protein